MHKLDATARVRAEDRVSVFAPIVRNAYQTAVLADGYPEAYSENLVRLSRALIFNLGYPSGARMTQVSRFAREIARRIDAAHQLGNLVY